jgi:hypothetical protein
MRHTSVETVVFGVISVASLPGGVFLCWLGLRGGFLDTSYRENVLAGLAFLIIGFVPPALAFASWVCDKRGPEQRGFEVRRMRDSGKAG